jgi:hypothetical protein
MKSSLQIRKWHFMLWILLFPVLLNGQPGLEGSWKYVSQAGEMTMQISTSTIVINGQTFTYKAQGNVLMIQERFTSTPYPYMLDGNQLTIEFPGGTELVFTRNAAAASPQGKLPQSMSKPNTGQAPQSSALTGRWIYQSQQGQLVLEFLSANQLTFNGETTRYQLKEGIIQAMGESGWIDYPYSFNQATLNITFPDGTQIPFTRASAAVAGQQGINPTGNFQQTGGGLNWQLKGALCSWSGSSNSSSSYSRTQKIVFDGQANFQFGTESSFSSDAGIAYGGNPNVKTGTYVVSDNMVTLYFQDGDTYRVQINMRQDNSTITELMYNGTLYAKGLCE